MADWLVGFRDGDAVDHALISAASVAGAADAVRAERPGVLIAAVIDRFDPTNRVDCLEYSDIPQRYPELRRYSGPAGAHHGYLIVTTGMDGSRASVPNGPVSLEQARGHRDWMLRGYFDNLERYLRNLRWEVLPRLPVIVRLDPVSD